VATRWLIDYWRSDQARRQREVSSALAEVEDAPPSHDDSLTLFFLCCHPALTAPSQIALTLRAVGGLTTAEVAAAFLVPEAAMAKRIVRAKQTIRAAGARFEPPPPDERANRVRVLLHVLYLMFNEGYTATTGPRLQRADLTSEAIRLTRRLHQMLPGHGETAGLLALMLLTDARRAARTDRSGRLVPLDEQDRAQWNQETIAQGLALLHATLGTATVGPYQIQAAIAAAHDEAASVSDTDWAEILALYGLLEQISPGPMVSLGKAVAVAMVHGPQAGLAAIDELTGPLGKHHRFHAVRGHLHEMAGDRAAAAGEYRTAAALATNVPERRYLERKLAGLSLPGR
jgi:predicted RNA polymerase sigma factor